MTESATARPGVRAFLVRWRAPLVLVPLVVGLVWAGLVGARMLWDRVPDTADPGPVLTCWDGSEAREADCPAPTGVAGLRWVFPDFEPGQARCSRVRYDGEPALLPLEFSCRVPIEGTVARVGYSERSDLARGLAYFEKRYEGIDPTTVADGTRLVYRDPAPRRDGTYEAAVVYTDYPLAVSVRAVNERLRDAVLDDVDLRPDRFLRVRPIGTDEG